MRRTDLTGPWVSALLSVCAVLAVALGAPTVVRLPLVLLFLVVVPGATVAHLLLRDVMEGLGWTGVATVVAALSISIDVLVAQLMVWVRVWQPSEALVATAVVCMATRSATLRTGRRRAREIA